MSKNIHFSALSLFTLLAIALSFASLAALLPVRIYAASPPRCYAGSASTSTYTEIACDNVRKDDGTTLDNDKCYVVVAGGVGASTQEHDCTDAGNKAAAPKCYNLDSEKGTYSIVSCGSARLDNGTPLVNNKCYVITPVPGYGASVQEADGGCDTISEAIDQQYRPQDDSETPQGPTIERETDKAYEGCATGSVGDACDLINKYVNPLINVLAAVAGIVIVIAITIGGIQYASAGGDAGKVAAAKSRIVNAVIAIVAFFFLYAVLQWIVPGGLF